MFCKRCRHLFEPVAPLRCGTICNNCLGFTCHDRDMITRHVVAEGLRINFDQVEFFNVRLNLSTQVLLHFAPIERQPPWPSRALRRGLLSVSFCSSTSLFASITLPTSYNLNKPPQLSTLSSDYTGPTLFVIVVIVCQYDILIQRLRMFGCHCGNSFTGKRTFESPLETRH